MTVEHLKLLHARGVDPFSLEPHKLFMDYHSVGFRECASEVARYLVAIEGLDLQDPLRLRLMSHLQCYSAQRDLVIKSAAVHSPWNTSSSLATLPPAPQYLSQPVAPPGGPGVPTSSSINREASPVSAYSSNELRVPHQSHSADNISSSCLLPPHLEHQLPRVLSNSATSISSSTMQPSINSSSSSHPQMQTNQYPATQVLSTNGYGWSSGSPQPSSSTKPYRPWGAELAY
ncbi:hairy/enhancer-of-split related with YRPW motif protein-like [Limulus polyphemus]|uniref:Hairy/enhancer-of-split related with YRPW motif protein-like n=1 Tax=Limulus polyphemus TaxID=6850 RepID=A0ABM1C0Q8_LIMPO|nr:hairy/enhancer-of-split related with YRPW motif protein-like [Limulus polyphemus]